MRHYLSIKTPLGTFESLPAEFSEAELDELKTGLDTLLGNSTSVLSINTSRGPVYFGRDTLNNSVIQIFHLKDA